MKKIAISIDVPNIDEAQKFFIAGLGFSMLREEPPTSIVLVTGDVEIWLLSRADGSPAFRGSSISRTYKRHWTPIHLDFIVDDLHSALERAIAAGAIQEGDVESDDQARIAFCSDPFGNGFCLIQE